MKIGQFWNGQEQRQKGVSEHPQDYEGYGNALPGVGYVRPATLTPELVRQIVREELERALQGVR